MPNLTERQEKIKQQLFEQVSKKEWHEKKLKMNIKLKSFFKRWEIEKKNISTEIRNRDQIFVKNQTALLTIEEFNELRIRNIDEETNLFFHLEMEKMDPVLRLIANSVKLKIEFKKQYVDVKFEMILLFNISSYITEEVIVNSDIDETIKKLFLEKKDELNLKHIFNNTVHTRIEEADFKKMILFEILEPFRLKIVEVLSEQYIEIFKKAKNELSETYDERKTQTEILFSKENCDETSKTVY